MTDVSEITNEPKRRVSRVCEVSNGTQRKSAEQELRLTNNLFFHIFLPTKPDHPLSLDCPEMGLLWINHESPKLIDLSFVNHVHEL